MGRKVSVDPTPKQVEVFKFLIRYVEQHGFQPSQQEMAEALEVTQNAVSERLRGLAQRGYIDMPNDRERSIIFKNVKFRAVFSSENQTKNTG